MTEKFLFLDVETTGTDEKRHGLIQVSGIIQIDGVEKDWFDILTAPFPEDEIDPEALETTGYSEDTIKDFQAPEKTHQALKDVFKQYVDPYDSSDKFFFVAYNCYFDFQFMHEFWTKNDDPYFGSWVHFPPIDPMQLVALRYLNHRNKFPDYKLMTVCEKLGMDVDKEKAHDAKYDIECTMRLFNAMRKMVGWSGN